MTSMHRFRPGQRVHTGILTLLPILALPIGLALGPGTAHAATELRAIPVDLPERFQDWLEEVDTLITDDEWAMFLGLREDYQRDAFIDAFWRQRDPYPDTARNEARERHDQRVLFARQRFDDLRADVRARFLMINGIPDRWAALDCRGLTPPVEVWIYDYSLRSRDPFPVLFYRRYRLGPWLRWDQIWGTQVLFDRFDVSHSHAVACPGLELLFEALRLIAEIDRNGGAQDRYVFRIARLEQPDEPPSGEWVGTFASYATDPPTGARPFDGEVRLSFPGWRQSRTVVQALIEIATDALPPTDAYGHPVYNLALNGEVITDGQLLDQFRYRFDIPARDAHDGRLPLMFQRYLRPGDYRLVLLLQDLDGEHAMRREIALTVPAVDRTALPVDTDPEVARLLGDANRPIAEGESAVEIVMPARDLTTGLVRFDARVFGERVDHVTFRLDGKPIMTRRQPPFSVELDFGDLPRTQILRVTAHDLEGLELASDERMINGIPYRFDVRFVDPVAGRSYRGSVRARVDVQVPTDAVLERLELFRGDQRLATLFEPPFVQPIPLASDDLTILTAVGYLDDGSTTEDVVLVNGPAISDEIGVDFVELYTTVVDRRRRPVRGLAEDDFRVREDGRPQPLARFDTLDDTPVNALVLLDVSASMAPRMERARQAALRFFEQTRATAGGRPGEDRIAAIAFNDRPTVVASYTGDPARFAAGIAGTKAERGTALYDSLIYAQFYAGGLVGHRAILLVSDGVDESSRFSFDQALDYARRSEVSIYAVGLDLESLDKDDRKPARRALERFARTTGGSAFFIDEIGELESVYDQVLEELRAKYLLAYQSDNPDEGEAFRRVEVDVRGRGLEAKTIRGYYP